MQVDVSNIIKSKTLDDLHRLVKSGFLKKQNLKENVLQNLKFISVDK